MTEGREEQFNTHAAPPFEAEGAPPEEDLSPAQEDEQLDQDPEQVPNRVAAPDIDEHRRDA